eukprot:GGOE01064886.1.p2 GENE.GGOE01064886.1~~GGOE01064886.1.p2  ORF type:complete len:137 (-),score=47.78 GGOE01064886.1:86-496(-)
MEDQNQEQLVTEGLAGLMTPIAEQYQERLDAITASQQMLEHKIDKLTSELKAAAEYAALPDIADKLNMLSQARRRVGLVNEQLRTIRERLMRLHTVAVQKYSTLKAANNEAAARLARTEELNAGVVRAVTEGASQP